MAAIPDVDTVPLGLEEGKLPRVRGPIVECDHAHGWASRHRWLPSGAEHGHFAYGSGLYSCPHRACQAVFRRNVVRERWYRYVEPTLAAASEQPDRNTPGYLRDVSSLSTVLSLCPAAEAWIDSTERAIAVRRLARDVVRTVLGTARYLGEGEALAILDVVHPCGDKRPEVRRLHMHLLVPEVAVDRSGSARRIGEAERVPASALAELLAGVWSTAIGHLCGLSGEDIARMRTRTGKGYACAMVRRLRGDAAHHWITRELRPFPGWEGLPREVRSIRITGPKAALIVERERERKDRLAQESEESGSRWTPVADLTDEAQDALLSEQRAHAASLNEPVVRDQQPPTHEEIRAAARNLGIGGLTYAASKRALGVVTANEVDRALTRQVLADRDRGGARSAHRPRCDRESSEPEEPEEGSARWRHRFIVTPREQCYILHRTLRERQPGHLIQCEACAHVEASARTPEMLGALAHSRAGRWRAWQAYIGGYEGAPEYLGFDRDGHPVRRAWDAADPEDHDLGWLFDPAPIRWTRIAESEGEGPDLGDWSDVPAAVFEFEAAARARPRQSHWENRPEPVQNGRTSVIETARRQGQEP